MWDLSVRTWLVQLAHHVMRRHQKHSSHLKQVTES